MFPQGFNVSVIIHFELEIHHADLKANESLHKLGRVLICRQPGLIIIIIIISLFQEDNIFGTMPV